jgi:DNA-binding NtrC family response regulator
MTGGGAGAAGSSWPARRPATVRGRLLLVDDEAGLRQNLQALLGRHHEVIALDSAEAARSLLEHDTAFDLVLCDVMMPGMSGVDLHEWLRGHAPALAARFLFMTGGSFTARTSQYLARSGISTFEKPFDPVRLERLVDERIAATRGGATVP